jgi:hypothetical protein
MVDEGKDLIERFAAAGTEIREQLGDARRIVVRRGRA